MTKDQIIEKLRDDEHYYGEFGKQFMSNSNIQTLLTNPLSLHEHREKTVPMLAGNYFHTKVLEPDKMVNFNIIDSSSRLTNKYKEATKGELALLRHEALELDGLVVKLLDNKICKSLIYDEDVDYETPNIVDLHGLTWKCKADILNHTEQLIVDLKTTSDIDKFRQSAYTYNYDSQAYIYQKAFGYKFVFIVICKKSGRIGLFDCSDNFIASGEAKVKKAVEQYELFYNTQGFDPKQYLKHETL